MSYKDKLKTKFQKFFNNVTDDTNYRWRYTKEQALSNNWGKDWGHLTWSSR